jgi:purine-binding chemotaxis protein CheW
MSVKSAIENTQNPAKSSGEGGGKAAQKDIQVVEFILGKEHFAIDLFDVKEVVEYTTITKLPNTPPYVKGIIDLRGEITTIVDLKQRLNINDASGTDIEASRIIVLDEKITHSKMGILVDDVSSVSTFEMSQVDTASESVDQDDTSILGIIKKKVNIKDKEVNELIIWIDIKPLVKDIKM